MGQVALKEFPSFRTTIRGLDKVLSTLVPRPELNIENLLLGDVSTTRELFNRAEVAQPLCTAIQIALVDLLAEWGLAPTVSVGHSSGEIGAAYSAGLLSAPQAILAAYCRGMAVKEKAPAGTMLAVGLGVTEVEQYIRDYEGISIACENSPASVTLSGLSEHISAIEAIFDKKDIFARELKTGRAYHSPHMSEVGALYEEKITAAFETLSTADNSWKRPRSQMISSVTGKAILVDELPHSYWSDNLRGRVMFDTAVSEFGTSEDYKSVRCIVEIGPHAALAGPFKQIRQAKKLDHMVYTPSLARNSNDVDQILSIAGSLFLQGYPINLEKVNASGSEVRAPTAKTQANKVLVDLPPYQWNYGKRYWAEPRPSAEIRQLTHARHDILGTKVAGLSSTCQIWRNILRHRDIPWLQDHKLGGSAIFPAAGHMALAIEALSQTLELEEDPRALQSVTLRDVDIRTALVIPDTDTGVEIILRFWKLTSQSAGSQWYKFEVESLTDGQWTVHCDGTISANYKNTISLNTPVDRTRLTQKMTGKRWYEAFDRVGFHYGNTFNQLQSVRTDRKLHHATGDVLVTQSTKVMTGESRYVIHPSTVDACLQLIIISIHQGKHKEMPYGVVPTRIEEATLFMPKQEDMTVGDAVAWTDNIDGRYYNTHAKLVGHSGNALLEIQSLRCVAYEAAIPVGTSTKRSAAPVSGTYWKPDVRALRQSSFTELLQEPANLKEATSKLIELGDHHHPASKMLIRGSLDSPIVCSALAAVGNDVAIFACSDIDDLTELKQDSANGLTVDTWEALSADTYDIVVADEQGSSNGASLISRLNANGVFLAAPADAKAFGNIPSLQLETSSSKLLATHGSFIQQQNGNSYEKVQVLSTGEEDVTELVASLEAHNLKVFSTPLEAFAPQENTYLIISDIAGKLYDSLDETKFEKLKAALLAGLPTLWITKGAQEGSNVGAGIAQGFLRVVRSEQIASKITLLDADSCESFAKISEVAVDLLNKSTANDEDIEFWLHQGQLYIPRVHPNDNVNQEVSPSGEIEATAVPRAVKLVGELVDNQMLFKEMPTDLASDAVEIQVLASKKISTSSRSPNTVCGTVIRTGESLDKSLVGQKVVALTSESFTTIVCSSIFAVVDANVDYCRLAAEVSTLLHAIAAGANAAQITSRERVSLLPGPKESIKALIQASAAFSWDVQLVIPYGSSKATYSAELGLRDDAALEVRYVEPTSNDAQDQPDVIVAHDFSIQSQEAWRTIKSHGRFILADSPSTISPDPLPFGRAASFLVADPASLLSGDQASASCALQKSLEIFHSNRGFGPWVLSLEVVDIASITSAPEAQRSSSSVIEYRYGESQVKVCLARPIVYLFH
jgi:acyl transferase domain-containing protein